MTRHAVVFKAVVLAFAVLGVTARATHPVPGLEFVKKNRYISISLSGNPDNLHIRLEVDSSEVIGLTGSGPWWAGIPDAKCISIVTKTKPAAEPDWSSCPVVHLGGCPIVPTTTYAIQVESGGELSTPVLFDTTPRPGLKWHGDVVGAFDGATDTWTPPNATVNADDFLSAIKTFLNKNAFNATHTSVTDVAPNQDGSQLNRIVNIEDVFVIIQGFKGQQIPGKDLTQCE